MRNNKNNITSSVRNITLNLQNITPHFTGKVKIITLVSVIIMLSFVNIINTSALSYQSSVGVGFTFNPTLSVNISPSDLVISNLTPDTTSNSNTINVSVATNAAYGYTLSAIMNGNNSSLTHTNGTNIFSSIATDASLSNLTTDNTWGYSYKLSNDTNWNNYSGLSTETSKTLINSNNQTSIPIDFKIAAKASNTQASGTYTGTINFIAVTKPKPINLADAYASAGKTMHNGYYVMQDMTSVICNSVEDIGAQLQVIDIRDDKVYWISKLADNHCWMTQNLDFDIKKNNQGNIISLTSELTDLTDGSLTGIYANGYSYTPNPDNPDISGKYNGLISWSPGNSTGKAYTLNSLTEWQGSNTEPYSYDRGELYPDSLVTEAIAGNHALVGNYYNWTAAVASNNSSSTTYTNAANSICPKNWRLQTTGDYNNLYLAYNNNSGSMANGLMNSPTYFMRSGYIWSDNNRGYIGGQQYGVYWTGINYSNIKASTLTITENSVNPDGVSGIIAKNSGYSIRCLAR